MDLNEARQRVLAHLNADYHHAGDSLVILDEQTLEKPYGWVFFYNSKRAMETGSFRDALTGNGPVVFQTGDGSIHHLPTYLQPKEAIADFERRYGLA